LLSPEWIGDADPCEVFGREPRDPAELKVPVRGKRVSDPQIAAVMDTDHVAGPRLLNERPFPRQKLGRRRETDRLAGAYQFRLHPRLEPAGADAHERDPVTVLRIHVRL